MQVLLVCLVLFFVASELYQWVQGMTLPLPMLVVAGVGLAIASNLRSLSVLPWSNPSRISATLPSPVVTEPVVPEPVLSEPVVSEPVAPKASVRLPDFISQPPPGSVAIVKPAVDKLG